MKCDVDSDKSTSNNFSNEWDKVAKMAKEFNANLVEQAPEYAVNFYKSARDVEKDFDKRRQLIESEGSEMSQKEFEKWEDALSDEIGYAEKELRKTDGKLETVAECEQTMIFSADETELRKTIEAQAGRFYRARMSALKEKIQSSGDKDSKNDLDYIIDFYPAVMNHLDYRYRTPEEVREYGFHEHEQDRIYAHNAVIKHLNGMNDLARKYHVRPFTVRNFWTSDLREDKKQTQAVADVMHYDRYSVQGYYDVAFSAEVQRRERVQERKKRYGFY